MHNENGANAFDQDGRPLVLKALDVTNTVTLTVADQSVPVGGAFSFEANGQGYEDRLVECEFVQEFTDTFRITRREAEFLSSRPGNDVDWSQYIGETATVSGTSEGTAWVLRPGR